MCLYNPCCKPTFFVVKTLLNQKCSQEQCRMMWYIVVVMVQYTTFMTPHHSNWLHYNELSHLACTNIVVSLVQRWYIPFMLMISSCLCAQPAKLHSWSTDPRRWAAGSPDVISRCRQSCLAGHGVWGTQGVWRLQQGNNCTSVKHLRLKLTIGKYWLDISPFSLQCTHSRRQGLWIIC